MAPRFYLVPSSQEDARRGASLDSGRSACRAVARRVALELVDRGVASAEIGGGWHLPGGAANGARGRAPYQRPEQGRAREVRNQLRGIRGAVGVDQEAPLGRGGIGRRPVDETVVVDSDTAGGEGEELSRGEVEPLDVLL